MWVSFPFFLPAAQGLRLLVRRLPDVLLVRRLKLPLQVCHEIPRRLQLAHFDVCERIYGKLKGCEDEGCFFSGKRHHCCKAETTSCPANHWLQNNHVPDTETDNTCVPQQACGTGTFYVGHTNKPRECLACPANTYQNSAAHRDPACKPHKTCGPGTRLSGVSGTVGPGTCAPCPAGEFRSDVSHYEPRCILHKKCVEGQNRKAAGTTQADTQCAENRECTL